MNTTSQKKVRPGGALALVVTMLVSAVTLIIVISLGISAITENQITLSQSQNTRAFFSVDGCMEDALLKMSRTANYAGGAVTIGTMSCTVAVAGSGNARMMTASAQVDGATHTLQADVTLFPLSIISWQEITN